MKKRASLTSLLHEFGTPPHLYKEGAGYHRNIWKQEPSSPPRRASFSPFSLPWKTTFFPLFFLLPIFFLRPSLVVRLLLLLLLLFIYTVYKVYCTLSLSPSPPTSYHIKYILFLYILHIRYTSFIILYLFFLFDCLIVFGLSLVRVWGWVWGWRFFLFTLFYVV